VRNFRLWRRRQLFGRLRFNLCFRRGGAQSRLTVARSHLDNGFFDLRRGGDNAVEVRFLKPEDGRRLFGNDARGARLAREQSQLAESVALAQLFQDFVAGALFDDFGTARAQDVEGVARLALADDVYARFELKCAERAEQVAYLCGRERREHGAEFEEVANGSLGDIVLEIVLQVGRCASSFAKSSLLKRSKVRSL